jgi:LmbE family N-acetylglucosaminyl deacetylase
MVIRHLTNKLQKSRASLIRVINQPPFARIFAVTAFGVLLLSTIYWAFLSVQINEHNADQLINSFLFENATTFHGAVFPGSHSFLLKWPLFFIVHLFGSPEIALGVITILITLLTVGFLAAVMYRIERRPLVFGVLCLALSSILLLVPTESYPGAHLPVNFAMLANRNIEYILYILSLLLIIRSPRLLHWKLAIASLILAIVIASDKLFLYLSLGGSLMAMTVYIFRHHRTYRCFALRWLFVSLVAGGLALGGLWLLERTGVASISRSADVGPYGFTHSLKDMLLALIYGVLGIFTNLGANLAFDTTIVSSLPSVLLHRLVSISSLSYLINFILALSGIIACGWLAVTRLKQQKRPSFRNTKVTLPDDAPVQLSLALIYSALTAFAVFVMSNHYYAVDARYLTIVFFTVVIAGATVIRRFYFSPNIIAGVSILLLIAIAASIPTTLQTYGRSMNAYSTVDARNELVVASLAQHPVDSLVGDYWRVVPIKLDRPSQGVLPLSDCLTPRDTLTSTAWHKDLSTHSFAYLLSLQSSITNYPACSIGQVTHTYGRPNSTQVIAGSLNNPTEILLFYDHGIRPRSLQKSPSAASKSTLSITDIKGTNCSTGQTIMNIVAHQDDDLLFINPDLLHSLKRGSCVRSVYLTAGDAGNNRLYWLGREEGSKAAYAQMLGIKNPEWISRTVSLSRGHYATIAKIKGDTRVSLIFLHLPDGGPDGRGFKANSLESLARLKAGKIHILHTVDAQLSYTSLELINNLNILLNMYHPSEVHTQALRNLSKKYPDHSDHLLAGWYAQQAYATYIQQSNAASIKFYIGYPIRDRPENVSRQDVKYTEDAFFTYASHDPGTCESEIACSKMSYIYYLKRQYQSAE